MIRGLERPGRVNTELARHLSALVFFFQGQNEEVLQDVYTARLG